MKYINQLDYPEFIYVTRTEDKNEVRRETGKRTTVATSGCGLCSAIMIADRLLVNSDFGLQEAMALSYESNSNRIDGTDAGTYFPAFAQKFEFHYEQSEDPAELCRCLRTGGAAIVHVSGDRENYKGVFSDRSTHYIVAVSEERDGRIAVMDPAYEEGGYEKEERKGKVEVLGRGLSLCNLQTIKDECCTMELPFNLFWRK